MQLEGMRSASMAWFKSKQPGKGPKAKVSRVPCRGYLDIDEDVTPRNADGLLPDSYLYVGDWGKGLAFLNGFNLGWYWPSSGPANTMCAAFCYISGRTPARATSLPFSCSLQ